MEKEFKVTLNYPFTLDDGLEVKEINFTRRPKGKQMREAIKQYSCQEEREIYMMAFAAGLKFEFFDLMDVADQRLMLQVFSDFLYQKSEKPFYTPMSL